MFLNPEIKKIIYLFTVWRLSLFLISFMSPLVISEFGAKFPYFEERLIATGLPHFIWSFGNFDGVHYLGIAKDAYAYQFTQAFFPFYPILIKAFSYLTFGNLLVSALIISNVSFLISLIIFYKLVTKTHNKPIALWSTIFLLVFPTSFFFGSVYTEGFFFLLIVSSFYLLEKNRIFLASLVGSFASATRLVGVFLAPSLITQKGLKALLPLTIVPIGFLLYVAYLKLTFNNALYFLTAQSIFGQERSTTTIVLLPQVFWRYFKILTTTQGLAFFNAALELASTIFIIIALALALKKVKFQWVLFSSLAVLAPTLTGTLTSMPRYIIIAFPAYIVLAYIKSYKIKIIILIVFSIMFFITTTLFTQGYWVA